LRKDVSKSRFRIILKDDTRKKRNEKDHGPKSEVFKNMFKRFKELMMDQKETIQREIDASTPRTCQQCDSLYTMLNMAYKIVK
jgi:hypothetical protein